MKMNSDSTPAAESNTGRTPPPNVIVPPGATLPVSFAGMSGGPVWGMELLHHKSDGHISIEKHALIGITFYEVFRKGDEGRLRAHFIKSIYDMAWRDFD